MPARSVLSCAAGALLVSLLAGLFARTGGPALETELARGAEAAIVGEGGDGVTASFASGGGLVTRHPTLSGGESLSEELRDRVAKAVGAVPGIGGIRWSDGTIRAQSGTLTLTPLHCQEDVEALLRARTIRFEEASSNIDLASRELLDEVAMALQPCLGGSIAIVGHTDASGSEPANISLSRDRAEAVREALVRRGIPASELRASGVGSAQPIDGLAPQDPANRRIEFSVIATVPLRPTPVDTPGPR